MQNGITREPTVRRGRPTVFSKENEALLTDYIIRMNLVGVGVDKHQLLDSVQEICKKLNLKTPFTNNRPSEPWATGFFKRHKLSLRVGEAVERGRGMVSEEKIRNWFDNILKIIK